MTVVGQLCFTFIDLLLTFHKANNELRLIALIVDTVNISETSVAFYQITQRNFSEVSNFQKRILAFPYK
jgi:hypothetical protein